MTGSELLDVFRSREFRAELSEMSSYLASVMQERPIVYLLAKYLWKKKIKYKLEHEHSDLYIDGTLVEFKFNYITCGATLRKEMNKHKGDFARASSKWGVMYKIRRDILDKRPHLFAWIICSRDIRALSQEDKERVCVWKKQEKYNKTIPYESDGDCLTVVDEFLDHLKKERTFSCLAAKIVTEGAAFPSTYHLRICEFDEPKRKSAE